MLAVAIPRKLQLAEGAPTHRGGGGLDGRRAVYHRRLSEWISRKTAENEATLEGYLIGTGEERVVLLGGYVLECAGGDQESAVEVSEPITGPEYEQLELLEQH